MRPDWKYAPEWAEFVAMDADGDWYWYSQQPHLEYPTDDFWANTGRYQKAGYTSNPWQDTLEKRP